MGYPEDVTVTREVASDWVVQVDGPYVVALDPVLTPDLVQEGLAREVVNRVQRLRKEADYEYTTRIELSVSGRTEIVGAVETFQGYVAGKRWQRRIVFGAASRTRTSPVTSTSRERAVTLALRRHDGQRAERCDDHEDQRPEQETTGAPRSDCSRSGRAS
jgi:isoleucyl-tRNA synthetase